MFKLSAYIFRRLAVATLFITMVLTMAIWLTQSMKYISFIMNKGLSLGTFLYFALLLLPDFIIVILPGALLCAILFKYNRLVAENELVVMRAAGMSNWQLARPVWSLALIVMFLLYFISLYLWPNALRHSRDMEHSIQHTISGSMLRAGEFNTYKGNTVYIRERVGETELLGLVIHYKPKGSEPLTIVAKKGSVVEREDGAKLVLFDVIKQEYDPQTHRPTLNKSDQYIINLDMGEDKKANRNIKPHEYYIYDLLFPDESIVPASQFPKFKARGHQILITPILSVVFALLGLITFLYGDYNRRGRSSRILLTAVGCVVLQALTFSLISFSEKSFGALILAYLVVLLPLVLAIGYLKEWWIYSPKAASK